MDSILASVGDFLHVIPAQVTAYLRLFFTYSDDIPSQINGITALGLFCFVLPLVGLGIGIIRRLVKIRA